MNFSEQLYISPNYSIRNYRGISQKLHTTCLDLVIFTYDFVFTCMVNVVKKSVE